MNPKYRTPLLAGLFDLAGGFFVVGLFAVVLGIGTRNWATFLVVGVALIIIGLVLERGLTYWEDKQDGKNK